MPRKTPFAVACELIQQHGYVTLSKQSYDQLSRNAALNVDANKRGQVGRLQTKINELQRTLQDLQASLRMARTLTDEAVIKQKQAEAALEHQTGETEMYRREREELRVQIEALQRTIRDLQTIGVTRPRGRRELPEVDLSEFAVHRPRLALPHGCILQPPANSASVIAEEITEAERNGLDTEYDLPLPAAADLIAPAVSHLFEDGHRFIGPWDYTTEVPHCPHPGFNHRGLRHVDQRGTVGRCTRCWVTNYVEVDRHGHGWRWIGGYERSRLSPYCPHPHFGTDGTDPYADTDQRSHCGRCWERYTAADQENAVVSPLPVPRAGRVVTTNPVAPVAAVDAMPGTPEYNAQVRRPDPSRDYVWVGPHLFTDPCTHPYYDRNGLNPADDGMPAQCPECWLNWRQWIDREGYDLVRAGSGRSSIDLTPGRPPRNASPGDLWLDLQTVTLWRCQETTYQSTRSLWVCVRSAISQVLINTRQSWLNVEPPPPPVVTIPADQMRADVAVTAEAAPTEPRPRCQCPGTGGVIGHRIFPLPGGSSQRVFANWTPCPSPNHRGMEPVSRTQEHGMCAICRRARPGSSLVWMEHDVSGLWLPICRQIEECEAEWARRMETGDRYCRYCDGAGRFRVEGTVRTRACDHCEGRGVCICAQCDQHAREAEAAPASEEPARIARHLGNTGPAVPTPDWLQEDPRLISLRLRQVAWQQMDETQQEHCADTCPGEPTASCRDCPAWPHVMDNVQPGEMDRVDAVRERLGIPLSYATPAQDDQSITDEEWRHCHGSSQPRNGHIIVSTRPSGCPTNDRTGWNVNGRNVSLDRATSEQFRQEYEVEWTPGPWGQPVAERVVAEQERPNDGVEFYEATRHLFPAIPEHLRQVPHLTPRRWARISPIETHAMDAWESLAAAWEREGRPGLPPLQPFQFNMPDPEQPGGEATRTMHFVLHPEDPAPRIWFTQPVNGLERCLWCRRVMHWQDLEEANPVGDPFEQDGRRCKIEHAAECGDATTARELRQAQKLLDAEARALAMPRYPLPLPRKHQARVRTRPQWDRPRLRRPHPRSQRR